MINVIYKYSVMIFLSFLILLTVSVLSIGWNLSIGKVVTNEINIPNSEIKIVGKNYSPSMRVTGYKEILHIDCTIGLGNLCWDYHGKTLQGSNIKILSINEKENILVYGNFETEQRSFIIDNNKSIKLLMEEGVGSVRIYPKFFMLGILIILPFLIISFLFRKS